MKEWQDDDGGMHLDYAWSAFLFGLGGHFRGSCSGHFLWDLNSMSVDHVAASQISWQVKCSTFS